MYLGEPPAAWVTRWRMIVARELLEDPERGIAEVAAAVGYASEAAFHRAFKRAVGQPPARWRRSPTRRSLDELAVSGHKVAHVS